MEHEMGSANSMKKVSTHMALYWGKSAVIVFDDWPGDRTGMYILALLCVFAVSLIVEFLSHFSKPNHALLRTFIHFLRVGLSYMLMLALMSFNLGVLLVSLFAHALGFFLFTKPSQTDKVSHLSP